MNLEVRKDIQARETFRESLVVDKVVGQCDQQGN